MSPSALWLLSLSLASDAAGQLAFKRAATTQDSSATPWQVRWQRFAREPWIWVGLSLFGAEFFLWLAVLSVLPLSQGILLGSTSILVMLVAGRICFAERLGPLQWLGGSLIALGVAVVGLN